jgi:hypothetical protein
MFNAEASVEIETFVEIDIKKSKKGKNMTK